jgi:two-component system nitrogen regulation response regulator GlnG
MIRLPPLRDRGEDITLLVHHYVRRAGAELGKETRHVAPETLDLLRQYRWPGNVRELQSVIKQALLQAVGSILIPEFLPPFLRSPSTQEPPISQVVRADRANGDLVLAALGSFIDERLKLGSDNLFDETWQRVERSLLTRVLQHTGGNQAQAARILGITRGSLRTKIREHGITIAHTVEAGDE